MAFTEKQEKESDIFEEVLDQKVENLMVENIASDLEDIKGDEGKEERNKNWIEGIEKDVYIDEVLSILKDMN